MDAESIVFHNGTDGINSDQTVAEDPVLSATSFPQKGDKKDAGGIKDDAPKARRYKDETGNWPPRNEDGSVAAWVSEGSRAHLTKQCKPCAFYHAQGCQSGSTCKFCHLC